MQQTPKGSFTGSKAGQTPGNAPVRRQDINDPRTQGTSAVVMNTFPFSRIRRFIVFITLFLLAGGIGYQLGERRFGVSVSGGNLVVNQEPPQGAPVDFSLFWDVWGRIHQYYIDAKTIDNQKLVWGAISGMVNALGDPYTTFLPPKENQDFKSDLGGEFEGIGAQLGMQDGHIIVVAPLKGSPAIAAGIRAGDWIIKVNDEETINWSISEAVSKIRGPKGTKVTLQILHADAQNPDTVTIVRDTIEVPSVDKWVKKPSEIAEIKKDSSPAVLASNKYVAYIHLSRFGDRLDTDWTKAVDEIETDIGKENVAGLIFDLRNNPGGYLDGSVYIASEFLKSGVVVTQVNSDGSKEEHKVNRVGKFLDIPLVVLINRGSASAAEIVAGALKDYKRATIVGETSFGKGSVQTPQDLPGGSGLHITTGKWLTPKGNSINKEGIKPDVEVKNPDSEATADAQLAKAVELILK